jgi:ABC-type multidrug transport system ATPase subunit
MEEADALSSRIGIMVKGRLRALGTPQELKSTHGSGYVLQLRTSRPEATAAAIPTLFPGARLLEDHAGAQRFALPSGTRVGTAFRVLDASAGGESQALSGGKEGSEGGAAVETARGLGIETYALSQVTLEQILLDLIKRHSPQLQPDAFGASDERQNVTFCVDAPFVV